MLTKTWNNYWDLVTSKVNNETSQFWRFLKTLRSGQHLASFSVQQFVHYRVIYATNRENSHTKCLNHQDLTNHPARRGAGRRYHMPNNQDLEWNKSSGFDYIAIKAVKLLPKVRSSAMQDFWIESCVVFQDMEKDHYHYAFRGWKRADPTGWRTTHQSTFCVCGFIIAEQLTQWAKNESDTTHTVSFSWKTDSSIPGRQPKTTNRSKSSTASTKRKPAQCLTCCTV